MTRPYVSVELRQQIRVDAAHRCGDCHSPEVLLGMPLEIEHLYPYALGGSSTRENLWLACSRCNDFKGDRVAALVPGTDQSIPFYHPRQQPRREHFTWSPAGTEIVGRSLVGQATVEALRLNNEYIVATRRIWVAAGWWPPADDLWSPDSEVSTPDN